jgi:hypothetical protein
MALVAATKQVCRTMTETEIHGVDISRSAYEIAWEDFQALPALTPDEKASGPRRLRWYIQVMVEVGERDPSKIARAAMGMLREYEQILRSQARVENIPAVTTAAPQRPPASASGL